MEEAIYQAHVERARLVIRTIDAIMTGECTRTALMVAQYQYVTAICAEAETRADALEMLDELTKALTEQIGKADLPHWQEAAH